MSSRDPISQNPDAAREVFRKFGALAHGFPREDVLNAAANMVINSLRQMHDKREGAGRAWDEIMARAKSQLMECYDSAGRKKGVFPYAQHVIVPFFDARRK